MEALLNLESVTRQMHVTDLRALYDKIEEHTCELKVIGVMAEAYNCLLPSVVMKKLLSELYLIISRKIAESNWNLDNIIKELGDELKARERAIITEPRKLGRDSGSRGKGIQFQRHRLPATAATLLMSNNTLLW